MLHFPKQWMIWERRDVQKILIFYKIVSTAVIDILYDISSDPYNSKGVLVNAYGIYSEPLTDEMLEKLQIRN